MGKLNQLINKYLCSDCLDILPQIENNSIDLILTDPPYNVLNKKLVEFENSDVFINLEDEFLRVLKPNGILFTFSSWQLWHRLCNQWDKMKFWYEIIIHRTNWYAGPYSKRPVNAHEYGLVFCNDTANSYFNERELGEYKEPYERGYHHGQNSKAHSYNPDYQPIYHKNEDGFRKPTSVLTMKTKNHFKFKERTDHPTQKDLELVGKLVKSYCPDDGVILDPFGGVGTVAIACEKWNRKYIVIEKDQKWGEGYKKLKEGLLSENT